MTLSADYLAQVFNTTIRYLTPILLITLCANICSKSRVFNIGLEGTLLSSAFFAYLVQNKVGNIWLAVSVGMLTGMLFTFIIALFIVKLNGQPMIVGMAVNTFSQGLTTFLLQTIFHTKGVVNDVKVTGLPKVNLTFLEEKFPIVYKMFSKLTAVDYLAFVLAIVMFIILYRTVIGFRIRCIGINPEAAKSLGLRVDRYRVIAPTLSGCMIGLAGCLLSLGSVTMFMQDISAARGYVALAANNLCLGHPLGAIASSALFGFTKALSQILQNVAPMQLLECIPYASTIAAMAIYYAVTTRKHKKRKAL
ncbi:MAG: ABC transporter permease [Clostridia bacterium]|nr:ABC transporter permease [Clostridia bacterium]